MVISRLKKKLSHPVPKSFEEILKPKRSSLWLDLNAQICGLIPKLKSTSPRLSYSGGIKVVGVQNQLH